MTNNNLITYDQYTPLPLKAGDEIKDFRGNIHIFKGAIRGPQPGRSAKVETDHGIFYETVFPGLKVFYADEEKD